MTAPTITEPAEVLAALYSSLVAGDIDGLAARLAADVEIDEPAALPYGGVHRGRDYFLGSVLGTMTAHAAVAISACPVYRGDGDTAIGILDGVLTGHATGEQFPLVMIERHTVVGGLVRRIDVYCKNPDELAGFYRRCAAAAGA